MKECPRCGAIADPTDRFCGSCGFSLATHPGTAAITSKDLKASDIRFKLAVVYFRMGKYAQAVDVLEKVLEDDPGNAEAHELCERARDAQRLAATPA